MWDILEVTHEGTINVKRAKNHVLIQEYELFKMLKGEYQDSQILGQVMATKGHYHL